ncbi:MAG TPA: asparagine synthase (glutamine-hydrolyzing), partial [Methylomirabilota bacterium]|nr:asparagine synthase (glutamine-hydrolyzing) [Methylomirabilota bacterium]
EEGFHVDGQVGLGVRRLRIIDLATGQQPIHNEDKTVWVVFNGEIYNYRELRRRLEAAGHHFYTRSDTETIVHLYEEHGDDCVRELRGMFTFALWDVRRRRLLLARDRAGEKQLYYTVRDGALVFGSEIKCLLQDPGAAPPLDGAALRDYFTYLYIPGEQTIFAGIRRLAAGHRLVWEGGRCATAPYWRLTPAPRAAAAETEVVDEFARRFREAVEMRLVSEVSLGAFLSGGIDSSAVVGVMAGLSAQPVKTFTIGYEGEGIAYDERAFARVVAERFATDHHEFVVAPRIAEIVPDVVRAFDEPFADSSAIPNHYIAKLTRQHVTVALSGVGGDEVGGGYERYLGVLMAEHYARLPRALRDGVIAPLVRRLPDPRGGTLTMDRLKRFVAGADGDVLARYERYVSAFTAAERRALFVPGAAAGEDGPSALARSFAGLAAHDPLTRMTFSDLAMYLPDDLLVLTDRLSMAHSLEVRAPFLDHELLEFVATIPASLKIRGWTKKYLLKRAFAPLLPAHILHRKKKGFSIPLAAWFRGPLRSFLLDGLAAPRLKRLGLFDERWVARLVDEHLACRQNHENKLWALLVFTVWHDLYRGAAASSGGTA